MRYTANADCAIRLMTRLWKVMQSNSKNMPKPTMTTGNLHDPVMKMPMSCPIRDSTADAAV